jgi:hypothetical protein
MINITPSTKKSIIIGIIIFLFNALHAQTYTINTVAGTGTSGYNGDSIPATSAKLAGPYGIAADTSGNVYVPDDLNNRVRIITNDTIYTFAGNGTGGYTGDNGPALVAELKHPTGVLVYDAYNIIISDGGNSVIREVNSGNIITIAGNGTNGYSGDGGPATNAQLSFPSAIARDTLGNLYITDVSNQCIRKVDAATYFISTIAGNGTSGFSGDGGPATAAELSNPFGIAVDPTGNIYIADQFNNRVRMIDTAGIISTIAGNGTGAYSGDGGPATAAELDRPFAINLDNAGNIYVADYANNAIRKISVAGTISTIAGNGTAGFTGDGGPSTAAELHGPTGISLDKNGNLYITDQGNQRIRELTLTCTLTANIASQTNIDCNGDNNGSAVAGASGGLLPYTYLWNTTPHQGGDTAFSLTAGTYKVIVTDGVGCTATASANITQPNALTAPASATANVSCNGGNNGIAAANAAGGSSPYTYLWSDPNAQTGSSATGLIMGTYTVNVMDSNGCGISASVTITQPNPLKDSASTADTLICSGGCTDISANVSGGVSPYTYSWNIAGATSALHVCPASANTYTTTVQDANGCSATSSVFVDVNACTSINNLGPIDSKVNFYPNPFSQSIYIDVDLKEEIYVTLYDMVGKKLGAWNFHSGLNSINASALPPGVYMIQIKTSEGVLNKKLIKTD